MPYVGESTAAAMPPVKALFQESFHKFRANLSIVLQVAVLGQLIQLLFQATDGLLGWLWSIVVLSALTWVVMRLDQEKTLSLKDAYFKGSTSFLRLALVALWLYLLLLPALLGQFIFGLAVTPGIVPGVGEGVVVGLVWLLLLGLSAYLVTRSVFAVFMVVKSSVGPVVAIKRSFRLSRRFRPLALRLLPLFAAAIVLLALISLILEHLPWALTPNLVLTLSGALSSVVVLPFMLIYLYEIYKRLDRGSKS